MINKMETTFATEIGSWKNMIPITAISAVPALAHIA
jgi:hypothetical protein